MKYLSAVNTKLDILSSINERQQAILNDEIHFLRRTNVAGYKVEICGVNTAFTTTWPLPGRRRTRAI